MSTMARHLFADALLAAILFFFCASLSSPAQGQDVNQHLRDQYQNRTFVLRGFPVGDFLRYDPSGLAENAVQGDWTADGFVQVKDIRLSDNDQLIIKAQRLAAAWLNTKQFELRPLERPMRNNKGREAVQLQIKADPGMHNPPPELVDILVSKIFLTAQDDFANLIPDYWKPCVRRGLQGTDKNCAFAAEFHAIPGVVTAENENSATGLPGDDNGPETGTFPVGEGVNPPRPLYHVDPDFSETARLAKHQGTVVLSLVVNREGAPTNIRISQPSGYGLDAKAVEAVEAWRFTPAEKDGQPVPVRITVEMGFHLH